jgi:hypothetical protein
LWHFITSNRHVNKLWTEDLETEKVDIVCKMKESTSALYWRLFASSSAWASRIQITGLPRVALEVVLYVLEERLLGHFPCVKTVMQGFVSLHASNCFIQNSTSAHHSEWKVT